MAVHDLSDAHANASAGNLGQLVDDALKNGSTKWPGVKNTALKDAFYTAYYNAVGDCRAGDTMNNLWPEGVTSSLVTLAWWHWNYIWNYIKRFTRWIWNYIKRFTRRLLMR